MKYFGIDTTKKQSFLFLGDDDRLEYKVLPAYEKHSETLMINIDRFLSEHNVAVGDIDVFVNVSGPGSFTGIRIGLGIVKAFAYAQNKPIVNLSIFELLCEHVKNGIVLLECTSSTLYYGEIQKGKVVSYGVVERDNVESVLENNAVFVIDSEHIDVPESYKVNVIDTYGEIANKQIYNAVGLKRFCENPEPFYIQLSQAERMLKEKETGKCE